MKHFLIILAFYLLNSAAFAQSTKFTWAAQFGGSLEEHGQSVASDANGNVYITGYFEGTSDFDPGIGTYDLTSSGGEDVFIQKLDSNGSFVWVKQLGASANDRGYSINVDFLGNLYITGYFLYTVDFDPGVGTSNIMSSGVDDVFILKLDANGNFKWAQSLGGSGYSDEGFSIATDAIGNVYTSGIFSGTVDFDKGAGTTNLTAVGGFDLFLQKLDSSGNFIWAKSVGGTDQIWVQSIDIDSQANVCLTGHFKGTADFNPGTGVDNLISSGLDDVFILKLDSSGNFQWAKSMGSNKMDKGHSITFDTEGNIYTTGYFGGPGPTDFDPGAGINNLNANGFSDIFIQKLNPNGDFVWAKSIGGSLWAHGLGITTDSEDNIYATGFFYDTVDFDPGVGNTQLISNGFSDIFILKMNVDGNFIWVKSMGGISSEGDEPRGINVDDNGNIYTTGYFGGSVDFNPASGINNLNSMGDKDVFLQKLSSCPSANSTEVISTCSTAYTWIDGVTYVSNNNSALFIYSDTVGFDSIVSLDLTMETTYATLMETACKIYTSPSGNQTWITSGTYIDTIQNGASCDSIITINLNIIDIDTSLTLSSTSISSNTDAAFYQWVDCNNGHSHISGETSQNFTPNSTGDYAVIISKNGCVDTSLCINFSMIGIKGKINEQVFVFPSPNNGILNVNLEGGVNSSIEIFNLFGQLVFVKHGLEESNYLFNLNLKSGLYLVHINDKMNQHQFQIVIN